MGVCEGIVIGFAGAQDRASNVRDNWISAELSLLGIGARYERMINPNVRGQKKLGMIRE